MKTVKLANILDEVIDCRGKTPKKLGGEWKDSGYRALSALQVKTSGLQNLGDCRFVDDDLYRRWMKKEVKRSDILLTSEAPAGQVFYWDSDEKIVLSQRLFCLRINSKHDPKYVKYYLQSETGQRAILGKISGSTATGISAKTFNYIDVLTREKKEEENISEVLYTIDKKIISNNKIIEISEKFLREIYDYWFVQFDFSDENGRPYKSSGGEMVYNEKLKREIPKDWEVVELGDIIVEAKKSSTQVNEAKERVGTFPFFTSGDEILDFEEYYVDGFNIFLNTGGNAGVKSYLGKAAYSTDTWCISAGEYSYILFIFLGGIKEQINDNCFAGSGLKHLQKSVFKKIKLVVPEKNLLETFNNLAQSIYQTTALCQTENKKLASLRDWLLPMLMNGQIKVKDDANE